MGAKLKSRRWARRDGDAWPSAELIDTDLNVSSFGEDEAGGGVWGGFELMLRTAGPMYSVTGCLIQCAATSVLS